MELEFLAANTGFGKKGQYSLGHLNLIDPVKEKKKEKKKDDNFSLLFQMLEKYSLLEELLEVYCCYKLSFALLLGNWITLSADPVKNVCLFWVRTRVTVTLTSKQNMATQCSPIR